MKKLIVLLVFSSLAVLALGDYEPEAADNILKGYKQYLRIKTFSKAFTEAVKYFPLPGLLRDDEISRRIFKQKTENLKETVVCSLCTNLANLLVKERKAGMTKEQMSAEITTLCVQFKIENERVCKGTIDSNLDIFLNLIDNHQEIIGDKICDVLLSEMKCGANTSFVEWSVTLPEGYSRPREPSTSESTLKILQITDLHYDPHYTPGKSNKCGEPVCCQDDQVDGNADLGTACGYWGDYNAGDAPEQLFEEVLRKASTLDVDMVYFTGDIISHRVWSTSVSNNTRDIQYVMSKIKETFPDKIIYSTLGNHEPHPLNIYNVKEDASSVDLSTRWLYQTMSEELEPYLNAPAKATIARGGFYVMSPMEGLKVVVINSNVAQILNWWLVDETDDPFDQLAWLIETLKDAEDNNESVHILSHFPPGYNGITRVWAREFSRIVERFANTITLQLNGHTHRHEWTLFYNSSNYAQVINKAFNGGSVTTFDGANPNFVVYTVDDDKFDLVDLDVYTFNITKANLQPEEPPDWYKDCSFTEAYELESMSLENLGNLVVDMTKNHSKLVDFHSYRYRNSDVGNNMGCDEKCQKEYLCLMAVSYTGDQSKCDELVKLYDENN